MAVVQVADYLKISKEGFSLLDSGTEKPFAGSHPPV
jgi:hypothetical protein